MKKYDIAFMLALLLIMIAAFIATLTYPPKARLFPFIVIGISMILLTTELARLLLQARRGGGESNSAGGNGSGAASRQKSVLVPLSWVAFLAVMIWALGYIVALPLFMFIYLRIYSQKWRWSVLLPALMFLIVYVGFDILLQVPLYGGFLFPN